MAQPETIFDRSLITARRNRAAIKAHDHVFLLERVAADFAERLRGINRHFESGLNIGAATGDVSRTLRPLENVETLIDADTSHGLLKLCDGPRIAASEEAIPFGPSTFDLVVSGLMFQLTNDLPGSLIQIRQALKPDGLLLAALLGGETLHELRHAWLVAEDEICGGASPRVAPFADIRDIGGLLQRAGFALPVVDTDRVTVTYDSPLALMKEIKGMGASNPLAARTRRPVTRRLLTRACETYADQFSTDDGRIEATFELITLTAWAPHDSQQKPLKPGSASARLADALGTIEIPSGDKPR